jgi:hypothetical protein
MAMPESSRGSCAPAVHTPTWMADSGDHRIRSFLPGLAVDSTLTSRMHSWLLIACLPLNAKRSLRWSGGNIFMVKNELQLRWLQRVGAVTRGPQAD